MEKLNAMVRSIISSDSNLYLMNSMHSRSRIHPPPHRHERSQRDPLPPSCGSGPRLHTIRESNADGNSEQASLLHAPLGSLRADITSAPAPPIAGRVEQFLSHPSRLSHPVVAADVEHQPGNLCGLPDATSL